METDTEVTVKGVIQMEDSPDRAHTSKNNIYVFPLGKHMHKSY